MLNTDQRTVSGWVGANELTKYNPGSRTCVVRNGGAFYLFQLVSDRIQWRILVNTGRNLWFPKKKRGLF